MAHAIGGLLLALMLVFLLSIASRGSGERRPTHSAAFRHVVAQTDTTFSAPVQDSGYQVLVLHPDTRTDFGDLEQSIKTVSDAGKIETSIEYHAWTDPGTVDIVRKLKIRMSPYQTLVMFKAPNGAVTWGGTEQLFGSADANTIFPSPGVCEIIKSAQQGKDVLLVFSRAKTPNKIQLVRTATEYVQIPANKAELFIIDPEDPANQDIVARTKLPADSLNDARLLLMIGGQVRGQLTGKVSTKDIEGLKKSCSGKAGCC